MDDILEYIEENFIFCTECNDYKYLNNLQQTPCPRCNQEEYRQYWNDVAKRKGKDT